MKPDFLLIIIMIGIMFAVSLPAYSEMQYSNQIFQENTIIPKQIQYSHASAIDKINNIAKNASPAKIILVVKYSDHVRIGYSLFINAKVFFANQNPAHNFDQYYGFIPNAKITIQILDPNGVQVKSFTGVTDNHGYYYQTFRIPDNSRLGTYSILISAQAGDYTDSKKLVLFIQHKPY